MGKILFDILEINIVVSVVILLVVPATEFLRKRYGARWLRVVWIILAVRLLIPYNFSLPNTEIRFFDIPGFEQEVGVVSQQEAFDGIIFMGVKGLSQTQDLVESSTNEIVINEDVYLNDGMLIDADEVSGLSPNSNAVSQENSLEGNENGSVADIEGKTEQFETSGFEYTQFMLLMWGIGAVIFVVYYAIVYIYFRIKCHKSMHLLNDLNLQRYTDEVQLKYLGKVKCNVYESDVVVTPMLVGLVAPKLVLPSGKNVMEPMGKQLQTTKWTPEELKLVVAHEICHYKSRDLWFKIIMLLACCINWFNPLVHIMKKKFYYDIELACDYRVLCNCDETEREQYAKTLLKFAGREYAFATGLSANKKRLKKRIGYIWEKKKKRAGVAATCFVFFVLIGAGLFISCGYKPGESNNGLEKHPEYAFEETSEAADVEVRKEFTYNNETNEMVRYYEETTYVARRDGIYQIVDGEMVCIYSNEYGFNRGMELYKDFLYFCGTSSSKTSEDGYLTATVYRINLNTLEVEDVLGDIEEDYYGLYRISIYEDHLYVTQNMYGKIGFVLDENGKAVSELDDTSDYFLYRDYNDWMQLYYRRMENLEDEELTRQYLKCDWYVVDKAECMEILDGQYVVTRYKDEIAVSVYLVDQNGNDTYLCDTYYSCPILVTERGVYYIPPYENTGIFYVDYETQIQQCLKKIDGDAANLYLLTYDEKYVYYSMEEYIWGSNEGEWTERNRYIMRLPESGGEAEIIYDIKEEGIAIRTGSFGIDSEYMYFRDEFDGHSRIALEPKEEW